MGVPRLQDATEDVFITTSAFAKDARDAAA
jgi:restriction endonuclease Mrr